MRAADVTLQDELAEAVQGAVLWHLSPDAEPGKAQAYEGLYDAVILAGGDDAARELVRAAVADWADLEDIAGDGSPLAATLGGTR